MKLNFLLPASLLIAALGGCSKEARDEYGQANKTAQTASGEASQAMKTDVKETGKDIKQAGDAAAQAAKDTAANAADATMTPKVKAALQAAAGLETKDINVDTAHNTISLKGSVPTAAQKKQANEIALGIAGKQYKLDNQLQVSGATGATGK